MILNPNAADGEIIWQPDAALTAHTHVELFASAVRATGRELDNGYAALWQWSVDDAPEFWRLFAEYAGVELGGEPGVVRSDDPMPATRWFPGRTLNFARHLLEGREGLALVALCEDGPARELTFEEVRDQVGALASHLRMLGVQPGDRVVAVLPNIPEAVVGLLATAAVGAVWSVCAPEFGPGAITSRFRQLDPVVVLASPGYRLGGRDRDRGDDMLEILEALPSVREVVWVTGGATSIPAPRTSVASTSWDDVMARTAAVSYLDVEFSHPLWVLFSSGTTGVPKGIVHGHGGALLEELQMLMFGGDLHPGDRYYSVASTSWVVWNSLVSSLGVGAVPVLVDGNATYPSLDRVWEVVASSGAAVLGVGAGFVHACAKAGLTPGSDHDVSALRCIQVTGSPLSPDGFRWVYSAVGDVWLASMSGGTDIAGCFVGGAPTEPVRVGYIQVPALGVRVESWDDDGVRTSGKGELVVLDPMPSMPLRFWGDDDGSRYHSSYFETYPGVWRHGDFIEMSERGILMLGRSDSTLNRNGIRLGSADIYAVVDSLPEIVDSMVVGAEIGAEGYYMPLFVALADGVEAEAAREAVTRAIRTHLSVRYVPDEIIVMRGIPHTRTGKKLEVPVKRMLQGASLASVVDLGAVDDAALVREYAEVAAARVALREESTRFAAKTLP